VVGILTASIGIVVVVVVVVVVVAEGSRCVIKLKEN
jgi:hypothetical protein